MAGAGGGAARKVSSLPPPRPKSPPEYPDLYGKRRELARAQMLEREIGFLEDEVKFVEGQRPASQSCKEVTEFAMANSDPFMPTTTRAQKSCRFWKWLCGSTCLNFSWICCRCCTPRIELPNCCNCNGICRSGSCMSCCAKRKSCCRCSRDSQCCKRFPCSCNCRFPECLLPSCSDCRCKGCLPSCPKCATTSVTLSSCCVTYACYNFYICC